MARWWDIPNNKTRLQEVEAKLMSRKFPEFKLYAAGKETSFLQEGTLFWGGRLTSNFGTVYSVAVAYPENFPYGQIKAYVVDLLHVETPHKYRDGHLCLYSNDHGGGGEGFGTETTAVTVVGWTAAWINAYEVHRRTGRWPGDAKRR